MNGLDAQRSIGLDGTQQLMARRVWKETSAVLSRLEQERGQIVSCMEALHADPGLAQRAGIAHGIASPGALLHQVSQLSQNAQLQAEWTQSATRKLVWQVLSPEGMIRLSCFCWPMAPDLISILKTLAEC